MQPNAMVHELGHNLFLGHAGGYDKGGAYDEYQDDTGMMGCVKRARSCSMGEGPLAAVPGRMAWLALTCLPLLRPFRSPLPGLLPVACSY